MTQIERDSTFEELLEFVHEARGFDYAPYKRPSLVRRFEKRMREVGAETYEDYRTRLEDDPDEFAELFDSILINVTRFYRDPEAWDALRTEALERIVMREPTEPIRVWSAGCATGEEAYTAAIILADALGERQFQDRVKIYATDVDEDALGAGRGAAYEPKALEELPADLRDRYFEPVNGARRLRGDVRRAVIFGRNNLLTDPPIARIDLLLCRNTLMYFSLDAQTRILSNFHFALRRDGFLFLGKAEALPARDDLFVPVDLRRRIFAPSRTGGLDRLRFARAFTEVSRYHTLQDDLERARAELSTAYRELHATVDELETTNEELKSTNEELETTNEELKSTNDELETMKEELRSMNEELETMNDNLRDRTDEALRAGGFLTSILQSIEQSVVVLDAELRVTAWSSAAAELWGLRAGEVEGQHLMGLDIGLPVAELADGIRAAAGGDTGESIELTARNRRGRLVRCTVRFSQLRDAAGDPQGVVLITEAEQLPETP